MTARPISIDEIVREHGKALFRGEAAYFLGSGISTPSGLPDWLGLMQQIAGSLNLVISPHDDLPAIAQYCVNADNGNLGPIVGKLRRALTNTPSRVNPYHIAIRRTNLRTIWTTNYDTLLERAMAPARLAVHTKDSDLTSGTSDFDVEILKIHGSIDRSTPEELVITQEQYEEFAQRRPALARRLNHDFLQHSMLFAGYSYRDPNINTIMAEARRLSARATRQHFLITKEEAAPDEALRQQLWADDLRRFGIRTAFISGYDELRSALDRLALASRGKSVFVTGGHRGSNPTAGDLGKALAGEREVILLDGQSAGIGREVANAFGTECVNRRIDILERIRFFPNPYTFNSSFANDPAFLPTLKEWRASLIRAAHSVVVFDGGMGTEAEIEVAQDMNCIIIPVPSNAADLPARLLARPDIAARLPPTYVSSAKARPPVANEIVDCLNATFPQ